MTTFTWLHLTDMHVGQRQFGYDRAVVLSQVVADLKKLVDRVGAHLRPDLILFTGDLAYSGVEYFTPEKTRTPSVESMLTSLLKQWPWPEHPPQIVPVPGNHDLMWQSFDGDQFVLWSSFHDANRIVRDQFFATLTDESQPPYWLTRSVADGFSGYARWLGQTALPMIRADRIGRLPGEYAATFKTASGERVGLLALNTAYHDLPSNLEKRPKQLALHPDQLEALGFADWYQEHQVCLVLTHHPPSWIQEEQRTQLQHLYFQPDRIALHLCGHLHELETTRYGSGWEDGTLIFQGRSLFGVEVGPGAVGKVPLSTGYSVGQLRFTPGSDKAALRVYPRRGSFEHGRFQFKGEGPIEDGTEALGEKQVYVRRLRPATPDHIHSPAPRTPSMHEVLLERVIDRAQQKLAELSGESVFLTGPPRCGKTIVVQVVEHRLHRLVPETRFVHRDLTLLREGQRGNSAAVRLFLITGISAVFGQPAQTFADLSACLGACLGVSRPGGPRCVLVMDAYHLLRGNARKEIGGDLRSCLEAYRTRFRLLLVSRRPLTEVAPVASTLEPSTIQNLLHEIELLAITAAEIKAWAASHERFRDRPALVEWMQRHTGGHPWLLSTLLQRLIELPVSDWPAWTGDRASDADRARGLHAARGPLEPVIRQLRVGLVAFAPTRESAKDRSLGLQDGSGRVIPFVATSLGGA